MEIEVEQGIVERTPHLKAYLNTFRLKDRRSVNNSIFAGQKIKIVPLIYNDFQGFGKLGVSSFKLNWDYSILNGKRRTFAHKPTKFSKEFEKAGLFFSKFSSEELRLVSCLFWKNGTSLNLKEKENAKLVKRRMMDKL